MVNIFKRIKRAFNVYFPSRHTIGKAGKNSVIEFPVFISSPKDVIMEPDTRIRNGTKILNSRDNKVTIKRYTVISPNCTFVTNNHRSTVGIPQILLGISRINDDFVDLTIEEDVWVGANATLVTVSRVGRGAVIGANSLVTKDVPPYALVVGSPARVVGVKFSIDEIMEHEKILYPEEQRLSREYLEALFAKYYNGLKPYGIKSELSDADIQWLTECAKRRKFTDKDYINRLKQHVNAESGQQ